MSGKAKQGQQRQEKPGKTRRKERKRKSDPKCGFSGRCREIYGTLRDASAIAEEQQALFSSGIILVFTALSYTNAGTLVLFMRACEPSGRLLQAFNFKLTKI